VETDTSFLTLTGVTTSLTAQIEWMRTVLFPSFVHSILHTGVRILGFVFQKRCFVMEDLTVRMERMRDGMSARQGLIINSFQTSHIFIKLN